MSFSNHGKREPHAHERRFSRSKAYCLKGGYVKYFKQLLSRPVRTPEASSPHGLNEAHSPLNRSISPFLREIHRARSEGGIPMGQCQKRNPLNAHPHLHHVRATKPSSSAEFPPCGTSFPSSSPSLASTFGRRRPTEPRSSRGSVLGTTDDCRNLHYDVH